MQVLWHGSIPPTRAASRTWPLAPPRLLRQVHAQSEKGKPNVVVHRGSNPTIPCADWIALDVVRPQLLRRCFDREVECEVLRYNVRNRRGGGGVAAGAFILAGGAPVRRHVAYPLVRTVSAGCLGLVSEDVAFHIPATSPR